MAENLSKRPAKGILKTSTSFETPEAQKPSRFKETKWDEMNILATLHPADKDYGHMKIEEPKTPYNWADQGDQPDAVDANLLAQKIEQEANVLPKVMAEEGDQSDEEDEEEDAESPEQKVKRKSFERKRMLHYNEFQAVKLARKLMEEEEEDDGGEEGKAAKSEEAAQEQPETSHADQETP